MCYGHSLLLYLHQGSLALWVTVFLSARHPQPSSIVWTQWVSRWRLLGTPALRTWHCFVFLRGMSSPQGGRGEWEFWIGDSVQLQLPEIGPRMAHVAKTPWCSHSIWFLRLTEGARGGHCDLKIVLKGETAQPGANVSDLWPERQRRSPSRRVSIEDSCWPFSVEIKMSSRGQQCIFQLLYRVPKDCIVYLNLQIRPRTVSKIYLFTSISLWFIFLCYLPLHVCITTLAHIW